MTVDFTVRAEADYTVLHFDIGNSVMAPDDLRDIDLPGELMGRRDRGLIISGRGPVWLYGHLLHCAHAFAWVGTYDPRLNAAVVVANHISSGPQVGSVVPVELNDTEGDQT
jgi:CRISPR-associated protein Csx3